EDLAARAARAGIAHRPEVVLHAHARETSRIDADLVEPDTRRLVVLLVDGAPEPLGRESELFRDELPRVADRFALEVVAEAEVAEHLEERVVAAGIADVLEIVVLAAGTQAPLRGRGARNRALLASEEDVLELDHAGVREEQRRIVRGHERRARHDLVAAFLEVAEKQTTQLCAR